MNTDWCYDHIANFLDEEHNNTEAADVFFCVHLYQYMHGGEAVDD